MFTKKRLLLKEILKFAIPIILAEGSTTVVMFTDRFFLSKLGKEYLIAASSAWIILHTFIISLLGAICLYTITLVAQYYGAKKYSKCSLALTQGIIISLVGYTIILILTYFNWGAIFKLFDHDPNLIKLEITFLHFLSYITIFFLLEGTLSCFFIGTGKSYIVMIANTIGVIINVPLNYLLIFGKLGLPAFGFVGSVYATSISSITVCLILLFNYLRQHNWQKYNISSSFHFDFSMIKKLIRHGGFSGIERFINMSCFNLFLQLFIGYGINIAYAMNIIYIWITIIYITLIGLHQTILSLTAQNIGNKKHIENAIQTAYAGLMICAIYTIIIGTIFLSFSKYLIALPILGQNMFDYNNVITIAENLAMIMIIYMGLNGFVLVFDGLLRGAGDTYWVMIITSTINTVFLAIEFYLIRILHADYLLTFGMLIILMFGLLLGLLWRFKVGKWQSINLISSKMNIAKIY